MKMKGGGIWLKVKPVLMSLKKKGIQIKGDQKKKFKETKKKIQDERNEILNNMSKVKFISTLRFKLIASFLIPISCIIILGIVSFQKASSGIQDNYEKATVNSINMATELLRFGINNVSATSSQYATDKSIVKYLRNIGDNLELNNIRKSITEALSAKKITDDFIQNIYMISNVSIPISTVTNLTVQNNFFTDFSETEIGQYLATNRTMIAWEGSNEFLDETLKANPNDYSMRLIRYFPGMEALLIIEIKAKTINKIMADLSFDQSGLLGVITPDGREIIDQSQREINATDTQPIFTGEAFYQEAMASKDVSGSKYVDYKGSPYLFMYSKVGDTGAMLCALMPKSTINSQVNSIRQLTIIIVIVACIIALLTAALISMGIDKTIRDINAKLRQAAKGDLTVTFQSKRKDEFRILIDEIQTTFTNMKELIQHVKELSSEVSDSASNVSHTSQLFLKSTEEISCAMNEIEQGVNQQAKDAEECLLQMDNLSHKIELVSENTKEIGQIADNTKKRVVEGTIITNELNQQTTSTISITTDIIKEIEKLAEKSSSISKIINVINDIANQTNLLSLNASIEAARAGEHGRGFAVVASEIRKLAEQSKSSVNDINLIIRSIQEDTISAVEIAHQAEDVLKLQEDAVKNTTDSYQDINDSVEKLLVFLQYITENVNNIEEARVSTLAAIENISAVLEEIAASTNNVNQNSSNQLASVESLSESAGKLNTNADNLVQEVQQFEV